jgi:predicted component of type VI protein secretion system
MSELIIQSGKLQGKRLALPAKEMVVGRDEKCDLRIGSDLVSRKHCTLKSSPEGIVVTDLGSQNGTFVNDIAITGPTLLREGDIIRIGSTLMSVPTTQKSKGAPNPAKVSDNEIADWLNDSGSIFSNTDTAVLRNDAAPAPPPQPAASITAPTSARPAVPAMKPAPVKVLSVKDEAAEVIRKHWESVKAKQKKS